MLLKLRIFESTCVAFMDEALGPCSVFFFFFFRVISETRMRL